MILNRAAAALLLAALAALPAYAEEPRDAATALAEGTQEERQKDPVSPEKA